MNVVVLRFLIQVAVCPLPVYHASAHRNGAGQDMVNQFRLASMAHGIDAALREGQIDGFGEIQRRRGGVTKVCCGGVSSRRGRLRSAAQKERESDIT